MATIASWRQRVNLRLNLSTQDAELLLDLTLSVELVQAWPRDTLDEHCVHARLTQLLFRSSPVDLVGLHTRLPETTYPGFYRHVDRLVISELGQGRARHLVLPHQVAPRLLGVTWLVTYTMVTAESTYLTDYVTSPVNSPGGVYWTPDS